jgi:hypothetical protein
MPGSEFKLDEFLKQNQHLFTIFGIFGALSLYMNTLSIQYSGILALQSALFASFVIFIIVSILIVAELFSNNQEKRQVLDFLILNENNVNRLIFLVPFGIVVLSVFGFLLTFSYQFELFLRY